jgi:hypothetical protein
MSSVVGRHTATAFVVDGVRLALDGGYLLVMRDAAGRGSWEAAGAFAGMAPAGISEDRELDALVETAEGATLRGRAFVQRGIVISGGRLETTVALLGTGDFEHTP